MSLERMKDEKTRPSSFILDASRAQAYNKQYIVALASR
jgi:hypothetical protein